MIAPILKMIGLRKYFEVPPLNFGEVVKAGNVTDNISLFRTETREMALGLVI